MGAFVLDASYARDEDMLPLFSKNEVIISDWFIAESYRTGSLAGLQKNLRVVSKHIQKAVRLKNLNEISVMPLYVGDPREALLDAEQSLKFHDFVAQAIAARPGDDFDRLIAERRQRVDEEMDRIVNIFTPVGASLESFRSAWTAEGRTLFLSNPKVLQKQLINTIVPMVHEICDKVHKGIEWPADRAQQMMMFDFRLILCLNIAHLHRSFKGNAHRISPEKFRNDFIDCYQLALGSYFNGFLTVDKGAIWNGKFAMKLLYQLGAMPQLPRGLNLGNYLHAK